jgi:hypothetical protein
VVLEVFGVGNMPDLPQQGRMPWLRQQTKKGLQVCALLAAAEHVAAVTCNCSWNVCASVLARPFTAVASSKAQPLLQPTAAKYTVLQCSCLHACNYQ